MIAGRGLPAVGMGRVGAWICLVGVVLALAGAFGPWVGHETAALTVTGAELSEFAKFFPQVQSGAVAIRRELFFTPPVAAAVLVGFLVNRPPGGRFLRRFLLTLVAVLPALASLPPYGFYLAPEYRGHLLLTIGGVGGTLLTLLAWRLPARAWGVVVGLLALAGSLPALILFARLHPLVVALYGAPVGVGWGAVVCGVGFALLLAAGILAAAARPAISAART